jgi:hypothetical protein
MIRSVARKVAWVGRTASMVLGLALVLALLFGVASMALGATGGNFILGKGNSATTTSKLTSGVAAPTLQLISKGTAAAATALNLTVPSGHAPLTVNPEAATATNLSADELDSKDSTDFLGANQKAANSNMLDGLDSTNFVHGNGTVYQGAVALTQGSGWSNLLLDTSDPAIGLQYYCPSDLTTNGTIALLNRTFNNPQTVNLFSDNGSTNPSYDSLASGQVHNEGAAPNGEHVTFQLQATGPTVMTIEVFSVQRPGGRISPGDCHVEHQAIVSR